MQRNLVICCDGTGNEVRAEARADTNVLKLFRILEGDDPDAQVACYDPGVGTIRAPGMQTSWGRR